MKGARNRSTSLNVVDSEMEEAADGKTSQDVVDSEMDEEGGR